MFCNPFFRALLFVLLLSLQNICFARIKWQKDKVRRIVGPEQIQLIDGQILQIIGIDSPDKFDKDDPHYCHARKTSRLLKIFLEDKEIKFLAPHQEKSSITLAHVKKENQDVSELLLEKGLVRFSPDPESGRHDRKYEAAETHAKAEKRGIWQGCNNQNLSLLRKWSPVARLHRKKFTPFLANISVGRVQQVLSGNSLRLTNGLEVKLLGVEVPSLASSLASHTCFGKVSQRYLQYLLLGKKVYLRKDVSQFDEDKKLLRYVFLDSKLKNFINQKVISQGYGKFQMDEKNQWYKKELEAAQEKVKQNYRGAWKICEKLILADKKSK